MNTRNDTNDKLNVLIGEWLDGHRQYINRALSVCDSPIEQMLLMAFLVDRDPPQGIGLPMFERDVFPDHLHKIELDSRGITLNNTAPGHMCAYLGFNYVGPDIGCINLFAQPTIRLGKRQYRPDFVIVNDGPDPKHNLIDFRLCIEVDGHDFHERTKEQARADRSRDRDLAIAGWHVLRFTGSEVWRDPRGCVSQVQEFVTSRDLNAFAQRHPNDEDDP